MRALVIALVLAGCALRNRTLGPTQRVVERTLAAPIASAEGSVAVAAVTRDAVVVVTAVRPRTCRRQVVDTVEIVEPASRWSRESRQTRRVVVGALDRPCGVGAAGVRVRLTLASGTLVDGTTDERGEFALLLPAGDTLTSAAIL